MDPLELTWILDNEEGTSQAASILGTLVRPGDVLALVGDLGAGKTSFSRALAAGMKVDRPRAVCSPTFTIISEHPGPLPFYHIDLYRIGSEEEAWDLGLEEYFFGQGVCAVEWFDRFPGLWPEHTLEIRIQFEERDPDKRRLVVLARTDRSRRLARTWKTALDKLEKQ